MGCWRGWETERLGDGEVERWRGEDVERLRDGEVGRW